MRKGGEHHAYKGCKFGKLAGAGKMDEPALFEGPGHRMNIICPAGFQGEVYEARIRLHRLGISRNVLCGNPPPWAWRLCGFLSITSYLGQEPFIGCVEEAGQGFLLGGAVRA